MMKFSLAIILFVAFSASNRQVVGYILGPMGEKECPQGFSLVTDPAECAAAAPALGFHFTDKGKCEEYKGKKREKCSGQQQVCSYCTGCKNILGESEGGIVRFSSVYGKKAYMVCRENICTDTPNWKNMGNTCKAYEYSDWCRNGVMSYMGFEMNGGPSHGSPEKNCCVCGKGFDYTMEKAGLLCSDVNLGPIGSLTECQNSVPHMTRYRHGDIRFGGEKTTTDYPTGCYFRGDVYWNSNPTGKRNKYGRPICNLGALWSEESAHKMCQNHAPNPYYPYPMDQHQCQALCAATTGCVGISYSHKVGPNKFCYVCYDDLLESANDEFGFYRKIATDRCADTDAFCSKITDSDCCSTFVKEQCAKTCNSCGSE